MSNEKVQAIIDWPEPWKVKDIQSFLGFVEHERQIVFADVLPEKGQVRPHGDIKNPASSYM
jgi:hypothetical protein